MHLQILTWDGMTPTNQNFNYLCNTLFVHNTLSKIHGQAESLPDTSVFASVQEFYEATTHVHYKVTEEYTFSGLFFYFLFSFFLYCFW
jgi:hypothetical protein